MLNQQFATALHLMSALGLLEGKLLSSEELAQSVRANPVFVRTLIRKLAKAGLVETVRGKSGGTRINRNPKTISLSEIYLAVEPSPLLCKREVKGSPKCPVGRCMDGVMQKLTDDLDEHVQTFFKRRTLAEVIAEMK